MKPHEAHHHTLLSPSLSLLFPRLPLPSPVCGVGERWSQLALGCAGGAGLDVPRYRLPVQATVRAFDEPIRGLDSAMVGVEVTEVEDRGGGLQSDWNVVAIDAELCRLLWVGQSVCGVHPFAVVGTREYLILQNKEDLLEPFLAEDGPEGSSGRRRVGLGDNFLRLLAARKAVIAKPKLVFRSCHGCQRMDVRLRGLSLSLNWCTVADVAVATEPIAGKEMF